MYKYIRKHRYGHTHTCTYTHILYVDIHILTGIHIGRIQTICIHINMYKHQNTYIYTVSQIHTDTYTLIHLYIPTTYIDKWIEIHQLCLHLHTRRYTHTSNIEICRYIYIYIYINIYIRTHIPTYIHRYLHTYRHIQTCTIYIEYSKVYLYISYTQTFAMQTYTYNM